MALYTIGLIGSLYVGGLARFGGSKGGLGFTWYNGSSLEKWNI